MRRSRVGGGGDGHSPGRKLSPPKPKLDPAQSERIDEVVKRHRERESSQEYVEHVVPLESDLRSVVPEGQPALLEPDPPGEILDLGFLWRAAEEEDFQDGFDSQFGDALSEIVRAHGSRALQAIERQIQSGVRDAYISAEALKCIGRIDHDESRIERRLLLEKFLNHPMEVIREGAASGLEELDDRAAIPALSARLAVEAKPRLRKDLDAVIRFLQR